MSELQRMSNCIGGEFGISPALFLQPVMEKRELSFGKDYHLYVDSGRSAILVALIEILKNGGKRDAWVPRYCCDSVLIPFRQLGFSLNYYSVGADLQTPGRLPSALNGSTLLFIHYFGKKNWPIMQWLDNMTAHDRPFFVIEDCVQASFTQNIGNYGDFVIASYRKFLPQPDGALVAAGSAIACDGLFEPDEGFISEKVAGKIIREAGGPAQLFLSLFDSAEKTIDTVVVPRKMSCLSRFLYMRTDVETIRSTRRNNWKRLCVILQEDVIARENLHFLFNDLDDDEVPLGFPVLVGKELRDDLRGYLAKQEIYCSVHWPLPSVSSERDWEIEKDMSASILTLPIDQRITEPIIEYMTEMIRCYFQG